MPGTAVRRADAQRNELAIVDAAVRCLAQRPDTSLAEIATAAGVGRVTLYGHFASRAELVEASFVRIIEQGKEVLDPVPPDGDPAEALTRLVAASWQLVDQSRGVLTAAQQVLSPARIRQLHADPAARAESLIRRGRREGRFRSDLPTSWLVATMHQVMHGAADEIAAGRLASDDAASYITRTLLGAFAPPR